MVFARANYWSAMRAATMPKDIKRRLKDVLPALERMSVGILVAVVAAALALKPTIGGISTWKVVLGVLGLALFVMAGFDRKR